MRPAGPGKPHSEHCKRGAKGAGGGCEPQAHDFRILLQAPGGCRQPATGQSAQGKGHGNNGPMTDGLDRSPEPQYDAATEVVESSALPFAKLISQGDPGLTDRPR